MKLKALLLIALLLGLVAASGAVAGAGPVQLSGHVQDAKGVPLEGVEIVFRSASNETIDTIFTDADGNYSSSLPSGSYSVAASKDTYRSSNAYTGITVSNAGLDFTMYGLGAVSGYVTDGNTTLPGVKVTIKNSMEEHVVYTTSPWGRFTFENVTVGEYIATAEKLGYVKSTYVDPVKVDRAQTFELNFTLTEVVDKSAQLNGQVMFDDQPVQGAKVMLVPLEGEALVAYTDAQGVYLFKGVEPGQYQLTMSKNGYIGSSQKVTLQMLEVKQVDVVLKKDSLPGTSGFILDYDLAHSLMVVALGLALLTTVTALLVRYRAKRKPEILEKSDEED